ncbi:hypothetical protein [Planctomyces sp. SH-PL62]|uniref:hypothetical protein n=1 Tax=Planctomyces sp. SH-PL62 TaxID=1636152 RepID=UPI00078E7741|nr:hypothetical protein [Planctomyces sp. SH-PL62]AMV40904.1 hypothetical protein VT85_25950 [Planctomyces sp. SH-PL62]
MADPNEKSDQRTMTGASGIRAEPADEGVVVEAADVVRSEDAPAPPSKPEAGLPAPPPHDPERQLTDER